MQLVDMKCTRVHDDPVVYMIKVPFTNFNWSATNCFVIQSEGENLVIDTGAPTEDAFRMLSGAIADLKLDLGRTSFLLTHLHVDHSGLIDRVVPPFCPLYLSATDFPGTQDGRTEAFARTVRERLRAEGAASDEALMYEEMHDGKLDFNPDAHRIELVGDGDAIRVGALELEVWECPGHTPGHLVLFEPRSRIMFCGDHFLRVITPSIDIMSDGSDSMKLYLDGLARIEDAAPAFLFQSHGALQHAYTDRIEWLIGHHRERWQTTLDAARATPDITGDELIKAMGWNVPFDSWGEISIIQRAIILGEGAAILDHLVGGAELERRVDERGIRRYRAL